MGEAQSGTKEREEMEAKRRLDSQGKADKEKEPSAEAWRKDWRWGQPVRGPPGGLGNLVQNRPQNKGIWEDTEA